GLVERLDALGLEADAYAVRTGLDLVAEPLALALAGFDRYRRPLWLQADAARAWQRMHEAAARDGVVLEAISGYRSHAYQLGIFERKLARGLAVADILTVNAAPGFSEHHSGDALDIGTPGEPPAEESFEATRAFDWLTRRGGDHGFAMSYPRGNPHGIVYEPWHWRYAPPEDAPCFCAAARTDPNAPARERARARRRSRPGSLPRSGRCRWPPAARASKPRACRGTGLQSRSAEAAYSSQPSSTIMPPNGAADEDPPAIAFHASEPANSTLPASSSTSAARASRDSGARASAASATPCPKACTAAVCASTRTGSAAPCAAQAPSAT